MNVRSCLEPCVQTQLVTENERVCASVGVAEGGAASEHLPGRQWQEYQRLPQPWTFEQEMRRSSDREYELVRVQEQESQDPEEAEATTTTRRSYSECSDARAPRQRQHQNEGTASQTQRSQLFASRTLYYEKVIAGNELRCRHWHSRRA
jgi:hypothetical protein